MEYQRQIHLQRLAEQEAEMQARLDQQRRFAQQREQQNHIDYRINQVYKLFSIRDYFFLLILDSLYPIIIIYCLLSTSKSSYSINITFIRDGT
jgi:hypothetical protein